MDTAVSFRGRGRGRGGGGDINGRGRPYAKNKSWVAGGSGSRSGSSTPRGGAEGRWERGSGRGTRGRGNANGRGQTRIFHNASLVVNHAPMVEEHEDGQEEEGQEEHHEEDYYEDYHEEEQEEEEQEEEHDAEEVDELQDDGPEEPDFTDQAEFEKFYQQLVKAREQERKKAIAEGKMDDPLVPKRLEDAITLVGTCMDMAPRFERYRRQRENNLFEWETIPGTKRVNHKRAVKMYERAAGDKTLPSDLRPPVVLKKTLDYLFHDLLPRGGFSPTFNFIRDRSRAVRNDFTMQHATGPLAIECHDRCARFHIVALHYERDTKGFSIALEEQQLMNTLQSLKEFYEDQRGRYESPTELEMRVYHRLIHIRDQKERHEDIPHHITQNPVFKLTTQFRQHVQAKSAPISKASKLVVDARAMEIFGELAMVLREQGSAVMVYLVACILERLFGPDTIEDIEAIRGDLTIPDIIDGVSTAFEGEQEQEYTEEEEELEVVEEPQVGVVNGYNASPVKPSPTEWLTNNFGSTPTPTVFGQPSQIAPAPTSAPVSAFSNLSSVPNAFGNTSVFGAPAPNSVFGSSKAAPTTSSWPTTQPNPPSSSPSPFGATNGAPSIFGNSPFQQTATKPDVSSTTPKPFFGEQPSTSPFGSTTTSPARPAPPSSSGPPSLNPAAPAFNPFPKPPQTLGLSDLPGFTNPFIGHTASSSNISQPGSISGTQAPSPLFGSNMEKKDPVQGNTSLFSKTPFFPAPPQSTTTPPSLPRINTTPVNTSITPQPQSPLSHPPTLNKPQPISLPSTPTVAAPPSSIASPAGPKRTKSILDALKGSIQTGIAPASSDVLSPLPLASPSTSRTYHNFPNGSGASPMPSPLSARKTSLGVISNSPLNGHSFINGKGKQPDVDQKTEAIAFTNSSALVKDCFKRWRTKLQDKLAWTEACRRSDAYSQKVQRERASGSPAVDKKRRATMNGSEPSPLRKRARKRISAEYKAPRTDEELARRFKANHEEHERRWAQGSFLQCIRQHIKHRAGVYPRSWCVWLSMNPESDGTAIWLEKKFDVPASGQWDSELIFSIPLATSDSSEGWPGLLVFECTPLEGIKDEIERKYRVLDDCSRLRDIIDALPARRHFVPSLLTISWIDPHIDDVASDFTTMVSKLIKDGILAGHQDFAIASESKDLDGKLGQALQSSILDLEGKLVQVRTAQGVMKAFHSFWSEFIAECWESLSAAGDFDWSLYGKFVEGAMKLLNIISTISLELLGSISTEPFPPFSAQDIVDSDSTYDAIMSWLMPGLVGIGVLSRNLLADLQSQRSMERDFPCEDFVEHLFEMAIDFVQSQAADHPNQDFYILKAELASAVKRVENAVSTQADTLRMAYTLRARRSPKRGLSVDDSEPSRLSTPSKRRRISDSNRSTPSDDRSGTSSPPYLHRSSPSPTASISTTTMDSDSPNITIAMLRALTRDVKAKYSASPLGR